MAASPAPTGVAKIANATKTIASDLRAQINKGTTFNDIIAEGKGYGIITSATDPTEAGNSCRPELILKVLGNKKFSTRDFNQAKVRAITRFHLETQNPKLMLNYITVSVLSGMRGNFIRQHLVDLKRIRIIEAESIQETLFGE